MIALCLIVEHIEQSDGILDYCMGKTQLGVTGSGKTQSQADTYANSNGSLLHLFGVSDSNLTMGLNYRTW